MPLTLAPRPDVAALAERFASTGTVSVPVLLPDEDAQELVQELAASKLWLEIFRAGGKVYEMPSTEFVALDQRRKDDLRRMVENAARGSLQYRYRAIRVSEDPAARRARGMAVDRFADFLNAPGTLELLRAVVGEPAIDLVDAQATDYRAGDFLTTHDDAVEGKNRLAAYVFSLTSAWQADWGGLLLFERGPQVAGFIPDFNALRVFTVPSRHHVSYVAPWVDARRLSITGWLRTAA